MRGKVAKKIRRYAEMNSVDMPVLRYLQNKSTNQIICDPRSTRGMYKGMKKAYKHATQG